MSTGAELGQHILQTQFKKIMKIQWGLNRLTFPLGTPVIGGSTDIFTDRVRDVTVDRAATDNAFSPNLSLS